VRLEPHRDHLFQQVSGRLFGAHQGSIASFTPAQTNRTKGENELWCDSTEPNKVGVKAP